MNTISRSVELRKMSEVYRKIIFYIDKTIIQKTSFKFLNEAFLSSVKISSSEEVTNNRKEIFDTSRRQVKYLIDNHEEISGDDYEVEKGVVVQSFMCFALKCSESNFKPFFEKLLKWSKLLRSYTDADLSSTVRKMLFMEIVNELLEKLGRFGTAYFGYLFDYFVGFMTQIGEQAKQSAQGKRSKPACSDLEVELYKQILYSTNLIFTNDQTEFVDSIKFDRLVDPIALQIGVVNIVSDYQTTS